MTAAPAALEVRGMAKEFVGHPALAGVDLTVAPGEIHALLGENGAGKSTLIKILAGVHAADAGTIRVAGHELPAGHRPEHAAAAGLRFVHQDVGLVDDLDVTENVALAIGYSMRGGLISFRQTRRRVQDVLDRLGLAIDPRRPVGELEQADKVMVAVARAFSTEARVIVLDEVTASLPAPAVRRLTGLLHEAARQGTAFVFVTHRLDEALDLADRVTVLRDGRHVASAGTAGLQQRQLVEWIVGREVDALRPRSSETPPSRAQAALTVEGLHGLGLHAPVSFEVAAGEVVAFTGLVGSGAREVVRFVAGAASPRGGVVQLGGRALRLGDPVAMSRAGCRYVPGDRQAEGAALDLSVRENLFLSRLGAGGSFLRPRRERAAAAALAERFDVRPRASCEMPLVSLSGGNQQKVVIGRALADAPRLLVLDDPTVGVDVGARVGIHRLVREAADAGIPVLMSSSDFNEVASEATRAYVMRGGAVAAELAGADLHTDRLIAESYLSEEAV